MSALHFPEPALLTSTSAGVIALHDIKSGTVLASFKGTLARPGCLSCTPTTDLAGGLVYAAQPSKSILSVHAWQKEQALLKIILPTQLSAFAADQQNRFCAGGTADGHLYIWEVASGLLFTSFDAHYRKINRVRWSSDGSALVTISDDATVNVWATSSLLNIQHNKRDVEPACSFTDHTLPVTDVQIGLGTMPHLRLVTSSIDRSCKLWDVSTSSLLTTINFPAPLHHVILDPLERYVIAASEKDVFQFNLFRQIPDALSAQREFLQGQAQGGSLDYADQNRSQEASRKISLPNDECSITDICLSLSAENMVVCTNSGYIHVYAIPSKQLLRTIATHKGHSITNCESVWRPSDLVGLIPINDTAQQLPPLQTITAFHKVQQKEALHSHEVSLPHYQSSDVWQDFDINDLLPNLHSDFVSPVGSEKQANDRVLQLQNEISVLKDGLQAAKAVNDEMWKSIQGNAAVSEAS